MLGRSLAVTATALALAGCATPASLTRLPDPPAAALAPATAPSTPSEVVPPPPADAIERPADREEAPAPRPRLSEPMPEALQARLVARARTFLGLRGPFRAAGERFTGDCSGFVQAVYAAEGLALRELVKLAAPAERFAAKATWLAAQRHGITFGADEAPAPGDLVFWHDTYDRDRRRPHDHGVVNDFTHVGLVESVADGTVRFLHRGWRGVVRGVMTLGRSHEALALDGRPLNSPLRSRTQRARRGGLAGELFAGYARLDVAALERQDALAIRSSRGAERAPP